MPQVEMGQGVYTSISMILAEELDATDFSRVWRWSTPPPSFDKLYGDNPLFGIQATGEFQFDPGLVAAFAQGRRSRAPCWSRPPRNNGRSDLASTHDR